MKIFMAPMQGFTDAAYRRIHAAVFGTLDGYFTPFVRVERGGIRPRDLREADPALNPGLALTPQIIFRDIDEFDMLVERVTAIGHNSVDLNLGCPYPPQVHKGRGSGMLARPDMLRRVSERVRAMSDIRFSVKMRLGVDDPLQWHGIIDIINDMPLVYVTMHPRTAADQYSGPLYLGQFGDFVSECTHPVIYNGDISAPGDLRTVTDSFPDIAGVMIGRSLLTRPSLVAEWRDAGGTPEWTAEERMSKLKELHRRLFEHALEHLSGDGQIVGHMRPYWEYFGVFLPRKAVKAIVKSRTVPAYRAAVATAFS